MNENLLVEVYRAMSNTQAYALKDLLEQSGIPATIENEFLQNVVGVPTTWASAPRILVETKDAPRSLEIMASFEQQNLKMDCQKEKQRDGVYCLVCETRLPDEGDRCPSCGWSYLDGDSINTP